MPYVARFSMTPVKGTALYHPTSLTLTRNGVLDNRRFYLVDARRRLFNGKQHGPLVRLTAEYDGDRGHLSLQIPGHEPVRGTATEFGEAVVTNFYGRDVAGHLVWKDRGQPLSPSSWASRCTSWRWTRPGPPSTCTR